MKGEARNREVTRERRGRIRNLKNTDLIKKLMALKKAYADIILNTTKEAAARMVVSERKAYRYRRELFAAKEKALHMLLRLKQTLDAKVTEILVVFVSTLEGRGRIAVMRQVVDTYKRWCLRLPIARLNCRSHKVMSKHSWKDLSAQPKVKYFTQVKARPPTFVVFLSQKTELSDTDLWLLTKSLKEDFDLGGIPIRIM